MADAEDYQEAADEALAHAEALAGLRTMSDREFLESMARSDRLLEHDPERCGQCCTRSLMAQTARDLLAEGDVLNGMEKWSVEWRRRWEATKFFRLWQEETQVGRDPRKAFAERGWEP